MVIVIKLTDFNISLLNGYLIDSSWYLLNYHFTNINSASGNHELALEKLLHLLAYAN